VEATWESIEESARRLNDEQAGSEFTVTTLRCRRLNWWTVSEGLHLGNLWTDVFEDVRKRRFFSDDWQDVQSLESAEAHIREFIRRLSEPPG
jgi:hypothetical protein